MSKLEEKLYKLGQSVGITFNEREAVRARLLSKIAKSEHKVPSPYSPMFYWRYVSMYVKPQYVSIALLVVLVIGGVSTAAENALPGEPLYQVKTSVNENVLGLLAFTPQSKAQLHTELAVRRLEEVEKLAIAGKLDASTTAQAENKIEGNLAVIKDSVKKLESENNNAAAANTSSKAETSLKMHEAILDTLTDKNAAVQEVAAKVGIQATALSLDREVIDSKNSSTTPSNDLLIKQQKVAEEAVATAQSAFASSTSEIISTSTATTTDPTITKIQSELKNATDSLTEGGKKLESKDFGEAFVLFKKAEKTALDAAAMLQIPVDVSTSTSTSTDPVSPDEVKDVL